MPHWRLLFSTRPTDPPDERNDDVTQPDAGPWGPPPGYGTESPETTANMHVPIPTDEPREWPAGANDTYEAPVLNAQRQAIDESARGDAEDGPEEHDECPTCTRPIPTIRELLTDIFSRVGARTDEFVIAFYSLVAGRRPDVLHMFPPDLVDPDSSGGGKAQRDRLLNALLAVASLYNPRNKKAMAKLNAALDAMAQTHGESRMYVEDPEWPAGRRPLLQRDYDDVNQAAYETARDFYGPGWTPLHTAALWTSLTYVADRMGATQILAAPRHAR